MRYEESIFLTGNPSIENRFKVEDILFLTNLNESLVSSDTESSLREELMNF